MSRNTPQLTPQIEKDIVAYIRAGGFAEVAAEAAGIPRAVFQRWLKQGEGPRAKPPYREFARAVRQAEAQARLSAELTAHTDKPLDWLRSGPGKETAEQTGWTSTVKARPSKNEAGSPLMQPEIQQLFLAILDALADHPEARAAVAAVIGQNRGEGTRP